jgi:hypothetical protein
MSTPEESSLAQSSSASRPKSERRYSDNQSPSSSSGPPPLRRKLNFGEELTAYHHSLFRCSLDSSDWISLRDYAIDNKETLVQKISTPGTDKGHTSETAENELKLVVRRSYHLLDNFHESGLTLNGNLSAKNILIDKYRNVKFDETAKEAVKKLKDEGGDAKDEDKHAFVHMIKREVFDMKPVPSDLGTWLFLVDSCDKSIEEALKYSINLMDEHQMSSTFTSLFDTLLEMEKNDSKAYDAVITELKENPCYANWQLFVNDTSGNRYLRDTFKYRILTKKKRYKNNPRGLLLMLRNSRQHSAKFKESEFARIVAEHFSKLLSDFQLAMHRQKCLKNLNLKYSMG